MTIRLVLQPSSVPHEKMELVYVITCREEIKNHIPVINSIRNQYFISLDCNTKSRNVKGENVLHGMQKLPGFKKP